LQRDLNTFLLTQSSVTEMTELIEAITLAESPALADLSRATATDLHRCHPMNTVDE
jgi:hypothetical protein